MSKTKIYGASDDLIEIDGEICEEANIQEANNISIKASDGTEAKITYTIDGEWNIQLKLVGEKFIRIVSSVGNEAQHTESDAISCSPYSDVLVLDEGIEWVKIGHKTFKK